MITRIHIDGFKSFHDFELVFAPFQVIVGPNGAGKSNLFDALRLLSKLADSDLRSAFQDLRGEAGELFSLTNTGQRTNQIRFELDLFVENKIRDSWGREVFLNYTRLRYELVIERKMLERLYITREELSVIPPTEDLWLKYYGPEWLPKPRRERSTPFISTQTESGKNTIYLHQDGRPGKRMAVAEAEQVERTVLSGVTNTEFPHAFAAGEEIRSWRLLQLNPEVLRQPTSTRLSDPYVASNGGNLPSALARLKAADPYLISDISRDLSNLVPGIVRVQVEEDENRDQYVLQIQTQDGQTFSSRLLSDGTLRLLVLATLKNDPDHHGVLLFEEPENGVHPGWLKNVVPLLRDLATDFSDDEQRELPLRQLLINSHSPVLVKHLLNEQLISADSEGGIPQLVFMHMVTHIQQQEDSNYSRVTRAVPVVGNSQLGLDLGIEEKEAQAYTLMQVIQYLENADTSDIVSRLRASSLL